MQQPSSPAVFDAFLAAKRDWIAQRRREGVEGSYRAVCLSIPLPPSFHDALRIQRARRNVVVELKRRSPEKGNACYQVDMGTLAQRLDALGVAAFAVRVDHDWYGGGYEDLLAVAQAVALPVLCRDVILDPLQITMARAHGAAAVVLDPTLCNERDFRTLVRHTLDMGLDIVLEARTAMDLENVLRTRRALVEGNGIRVIGIDAPVAYRRRNDKLIESLAGGIPEHSVRFCLTPAEDGDDLDALEQMGYEAFVVSDAVLDCDDLDSAALSLWGPLAHGG